MNLAELLFFPALSLYDISFSGSVLCLLHVQQRIKLFDIEDLT